MSSGLRQLLNRPLFGSCVIPPNARVDPSLFSEDEFPIHCPRCGYLLRGLPGPVCPECGTTFDRGRLLVEEYLRRDWRSFTSRKRQLRLLLVAAAGLGACYALRIAGHLYFRHLAAVLPAGGPAPVDRLLWAVRGFMAVDVIALLFILLVVALAIRDRRRTASQRRRIMEALQDSLIPHA